MVKNFENIRDLIANSAASFPENIAFKIKW